MIQTILSTELSNSRNTAKFSIDTPSKCPHCGVAVSPQFLSSYFVELKKVKNDLPTYRIFVTFLCNNCIKAFNSEYKFQNLLCYSNTTSATLTATYPVYHSSITHREEIKKLSPKYVQIYNESHFAEEANLKEICGMGYRKALEFLIKDYAIKLNPDDEEKIKNCTLANCINSYISTERIKALAKASAWLGNDETHYCRKHADYDLNSLKAFINATESFINSEMEAIKAEELLRNPK